MKPIVVLVATFLGGLLCGCAITLPSRMRHKETPERADNGPIA